MKCVLSPTTLVPPTVIVSAVLIGAVVLTGQRSGSLRIIKSDERVSRFQGHVFRSSYEIVRGPNSPSAIRFEQAIVNESPHVALQVRWPSSGLILNRLTEAEPARNTYTLSFFFAPKEFDAFTDEGIPSIEIDWDDNGTVLTDRKNGEAPALLPRREVWIRRWRINGPYRRLGEQLDELLDDGFEVLGDFAKGNSSVRTVSSVRRLAGTEEFLYSYRIQSTTEVYLRWLATEPSGGDGGVPAGVRVAPNQEFGITYGGIEPNLVMDLLVMSQEQDALRSADLQDLADRNDYYDRLLGFYRLDPDFGPAGDLVFERDVYAGIETAMAPALVPADLQFRLR